MIKSIREARLTDGIPRVVAAQAWVKALSAALGELQEKALGYADDSQIYTALDTCPVEVLDALAVTWKIDWYDTDFSEEQKRRVIKTSLLVRRTMGTTSAMRTQVSAIYPDSDVEEWFTYNGTPGTFRMDVNITATTPDNPIVAYEPAEMERRLAPAKRWSAHMDTLSYMVRHAIAVQVRIQKWQYEVPRCGTIRCGTWPEISTKGWSGQAGVTMGGKADAFIVVPPVCGTRPEAATLGCSVSGAVAQEGAAEAFTITPPRCGTKRCGAR